MTDLSRRKNVRGGHRASATKMVRKVQELLALDPPDQSQLARIKLSLQEKMSILKQLDSEVVNLVKEEEIADEIERADAYMEDIYDTMAKLEQLQKNSTADPSAAMVVRREAPSESKVKLPKLTIQPFKGELTTWTTFWDSYQVAIHNNRSLSGIEKFNYLRSLLQGPALDAIAGLTLTDANYMEAVEVLTKRFGNKQLIIDRYMEVLLSVEAVTSDSNLKALRHLYDTVEAQVRGLKSMGVEAETYGALLSSVVLGKIPHEIRLVISRELGDGERKLEDLMKNLLSELQAQERAAASDTAGKGREKTVKTHSTAAALFTGGQKAPPTCCYCQQSHFSHACTNVESIDERKRILRSAGRCFMCLRRGHLARQCNSKSRCYSCGGRHHGSICSGQKAASSDTRPKETRRNLPTMINLSTGMNPTAVPFKSSTSIEPPTSTALWTGGSQAILLQTARANVFNPVAPERSCQVRIVFDSGSQRSYVREKIAQRLSLITEAERPLTIMTFGSTREQRHICRLVRLGLTTRDGTLKHLRLFTVPMICEPIACQPISICCSDFGHLARIDLADSSNGHGSLEVDILIGSDQYWELVTGETRRGSAGPVAISTKLGWVLSGPTAATAPDVPASCLVTHTLRVDGLSSESQLLDNRIKSFWELELFGIMASEHSVHDEFGSSIRLVEGRYEVQLPWKDAHPALPDNYQLCLKRLHGLVKRLKQDPTILCEYDSTIKKQVQQGIVERVESSEEEPKRVHYLPHHAVVRQDKETTKLRVVYDASARSTGPSLNDCLHVGPKLSMKIFDILLRFRAYPIAIIADIEKAFLMISVAKKDRDVLRFLWYRDAFGDQLDLMELRFTRVVFGVSSSPFLLNATIRHHLEKYEATHPSLIKKLQRSLYVDDLASGAEDEEQAYQMFTVSKKILEEAGFNLRKFYSNSATLQARVDSDASQENHTREPKSTGQLEESYASSTLGRGQGLQLGEQKVLGVRWDTSTDQLMVNLDEIALAARSLTPTKRNIVSLVGRFYDPLGYLTPVVVHFKIFLRELCKAKIDWDQLLFGELMEEWNTLRLSLQCAPSISIPRCYFESPPEEVISCTLYGFCDASSRAYAGVVYLLLETSVGYSVKFVAAKTRVAPLQCQTIPRLELLSALLLARLLSTITKSLEFELPLSAPHCFTDSRVSLCWIMGIDKTWKAFVQNRVTEIRRLIAPTCWRHCPGKDNPADIPSRGITPLELSTRVLWHVGPPWLGKGEPSSSIGNEEVQLPVECLSELRSKDQQLVHGLLMAGTATKLSQMIDCKKFGSFERLISTTALVLKFGRILLNKIRPNNTKESCDLKAEAEHRWILECQELAMCDKKFEHWRRQLDLFQDENGVWRCRGRIENAAVPYSTKYPALLHKDHPFTSLLVWKAHGQVLHNGVKETLTELRSRFWIVRGRSLVKKLIQQCRICRRHEGKPYSAPQPPPLPLFRVEEAPPFTFTGCDFAGPLYIKSESGQKKTWICLYTCCVVRAVHLELVMDLTTPTFLRCFKRFVGRRGLPKMMVSDNGKTFKAASKSIQDVKWTFNIPKAPWWGGVFERLVRSVKRCLKKMLSHARLSYDELLTALVEVEMVLNSRPLTVVSAEDTEEPLTPSHLMIGRRLRDAPDPQCPEPEEFKVECDVVTKRAKYLSRTIDQFWQRWRKEYLVGLREMHNQYRKKSHAPTIAVGDVVVVHSEDQPRALWKLGVVAELLVGTDGENRAAVVRVAGQGRAIKHLRRPVQKLFPLEMAVMASEQEEKTPEPEPGPEMNLDPNPELDPDPPARRSRRAAAQTARDRLMAQALESDESDC